MPTNLRKLIALGTLAASLSGGGSVIASNVARFAAHTADAGQLNPHCGGGWVHDHQYCP
jgi:hypothetical protein